MSDFPDFPTDRLKAHPECTRCQELLRRENLAETIVEEDAWIRAVGDHLHEAHGSTTWGNPTILQSPAIQEAISALEKALEPLGVRVTVVLCTHGSGREERLLTISGVTVDLTRTASIVRALVRAGVYQVSRRPRTVT